MRRIVQALVISGFMLAFAGSVSAATLTLTDTYGGAETIWTLTVQTGCVTCDVKLEGFFKDPAGSATNPYAGTYLDSVQWVISNPNVDPTDVGFQSTTAGSASDWSFSIDSSLSSGQCDGGATDAVCGEWVSGGSGAGFGPIGNGSTLEWNFKTTFASALPADLVSGNIRAAFNRINPANGKTQNFNIFSPNGGTFQTSSSTSTPASTSSSSTPSTSTSTSGTVPEPGVMSLLGLGLCVAGRRLRRKTA